MRKPILAANWKMHKTVGEAVAHAVARSGAASVVGGGDSLAAVAKVGVGGQITHLSTGGGASLEYVQGLELPGVAALERK